MENIFTESYEKYVNTKIETFNNNEKQTIIFFCDAYFPIIDGVVNVIHNQAKALSKKYNVVVCVASAKDDLIETNDEYLVLCCKSLFIHKLNYSIGQPNKDKRFKQWLSQIKKVTFVSIHSPFYVGKFGLKFAKKNNYPVYATFHSQYKKDFVLESKSHLIAFFLLKSIMKVFNNVNAVFTMNDKCEETLSTYGCKNKNVIILPHGIEQVEGDPKKNINKIMEEYKIRKDVSILLFVGRIVKQKNVDFIADVLKELKNTCHHEFQMIFVGDGSRKAKLEKKINKYGLKDDVIFTGHISDKLTLLSFYNLSDLFLFPSTYDTFGLVKVEATSQNLPVIFLEDTVVSSGVIDNFNGYIGKDNPLLFANKIIEALNDKSNKNKIIKNAKHDFLLSWEEIVDQLIEKLNAQI